jgi:hypothetical protein
MDLEETEARNGCAGEGQQQFKRPTEMGQPVVCVEERASSWVSVRLSRPQERVSDQ